MFSLSRLLYLFLRGIELSDSEILRLLGLLVTVVKLRFFRTERLPIALLLK